MVPSSLLAVFVHSFFAFLPVHLAGLRGMFSRLGE